MQQEPIWGYRFEEFTLDLDRRRLSRNGQEVMAPSGRAFDVLAYLLANRDRMVSKHELLDAVWPSVVVEENNLSQAISIVRRALGDSRDEPRFVVTVARRGYKFVGDATPMIQPAADSTGPTAPLPPDEPAPAPAALLPAEPAPTPAEPSLVEPTSAPKPIGVHADQSQRSGPVSRRAMLLGVGATAVATAAGVAWSLRPKPSSRLPASIAVLPFKPLLSDSRDEAIEVGVAELLINRLSVLPGVVVMPLSSVHRYAKLEQDPLQAGRELDAAAVVDGYVQIRDGNVRLTARLLDVATGESLWAGNYTEKLGDFFAVQDSLATQLVNALSVDIPLDARRRLVAHSTSDAEAWRLYAHGRYQLQLRDEKALANAREYFRAAERRDPKFALAITGLSEAWALAATFSIVPPEEGFGQARSAAARALVIDARLPEALVAMGHVKTQFDHEFEQARSLYRRALALAPAAAWTFSYLALNTTQSGSIAHARDYIGRAQALEPAAMPFMAIGGFVEYFARNYDAARRQLGGIVESAPGAIMPRQFLARVMLILGQGLAVIRMLEGRNGTAPGSFSNLGRAYVQVGRIDEARAEIARVEGLGENGFGVGFDLALMHLALDEYDQSLTALERAVDDHSQMIGYLNVEPALDPIRGDARFRAVARRIGLA